MARISTQAPSKTPARRRSPKTTQSSTTPPTVRLEEIALRAYEKFVQRGCLHGFDQQDWLEAEEELLAEAKESQ
jgi:hypothetical protein